MRLLCDAILPWGRCPQTPGISRVPARMSHGGGWRRPRPFRRLSRRSGCVPAVPYPPLRSFQRGQSQPRRAMIFQRTAITPLTSCLTPGVQFSAGRAPLLPRCGGCVGGQDCKRGVEERRPLRASATKVTGFLGNPMRSNSIRLECPFNSADLPACLLELDRGVALGILVLQVSWLFGGGRSQHLFHPPERRPHVEAMPDPVFGACNADQKKQLV